MPASTVYEALINPRWVDPSGNLQNAYVGVLLSSASDALMDRLGMDAAYRARTACTLFTLETHTHWLGQVKGSGAVEIDAHVLAFDRKRLHVAFELRAKGLPAVVATQECMYLHVHQGDKPSAVPFGEEAQQAIRAFQALDVALPWAGPGSRAISVRSS